MQLWIAATVPHQTQLSQKKSNSDGVARRKSFVNSSLIVGTERDLCILVLLVAAGPQLAMTEACPSRRRKISGYSHSQKDV